MQVIELTITVMIAATKLAAQGRRVAPPAALAWSVLLIGACHLAGCRLFIWGLQSIPVSIAQTIRAANPLVTVLLGTTVFGHRFPSAAVLAALLVLLAGFSLAVSGDEGDVGPWGVAAAVGSLCCLAMVNALTKRLLGKASAAESTGGKAGGGKVETSELQCW